MAILAAQSIPVAGIVPTYVAAAAGGDQAPVGKGYFLVVRNGGGAGITVTVPTFATVKGLTVQNVVLSVPAGGSGVIPLGTIHRNPATGRADVTYSGVTTVTVGVLLGS